MISKDDAERKWPVISVVTVVYNGVATLEPTILSVINQTYSNLEYIIIDGGSLDGTVDIIRKYERHLAYWISEPDKGIYDAMNKGIDKATGDYTIFMNSGDYFYTPSALEQVINTCANNYQNYDLIYGRAKIIKPDGSLFDLHVAHTHTELWKGPSFRHGALLARTEILKTEKFELSEQLKIAADFDFIYKCYKKKYRFFEADVLLIAFLEKGVSDDPYKHLQDNIYILKKYGDWHLRERIHFMKKYIRLTVGRSFLRKIYIVMQAFFLEYFPNYWINKIPFYFIRHGYYKRLMGMKMGKGSSIHLNCFIYGSNIRMGDNCVINRRCFLDGRGKLQIGNKVSISPDVHIITADHDYNASNFSLRSQDVYIDDYVWIGSRATILPGVRIGKGAVVCACAVVTKDVEEFAVVAGIPARKIKERNRDINYNPRWMAYFD